MKMLNCSECGLTITDAQKECPKCHTKVESNTYEAEKDTEGLSVVEGKEETFNPDHTEPVKEEVLEDAVETEEVTTHERTEEASEKTKEEMIAAAVEAEVLAAIEEENEEGLCETCMAPIEDGQNFCQLCGSSIVTIEETQAPVIPKTDEEANKWMAAIGYIAFFLPVLCGSHRKSKFVNYHIKQAVTLFITSTVLFLGLVVFRNILNDLFTASPNLDDLLAITDTSWQHGTGVLFHYYLTWMIYALHLIPFALMSIGFFNALQSKKKELPLIGRLLKSGETILNNN